MKSYKRIESVKVSIGILRFLSEQKEPVGGKEISRALDLPHGTTMCHLTTLEDERLVRCMGGAWDLDIGMSHFWAKRKAFLESRMARDRAELIELGG